MALLLCALLLLSFLCLSGARRRKHRFRSMKLGDSPEEDDLDLNDELSENDYWHELPASNLTQWYTPFDLCMLRNDTNHSVNSIMSHCEQEASIRQESLLPVRCRAGNSWPSKGEFCSSEDIPFTQRKNLRRAIIGYDDPFAKPLQKLFQGLVNEKSSLLLVGDSVMQQFYGAMACELEREKIWLDPSQFKNTDALKHVEMKISKGPHTIGESHAVPIKFLPIYHFVNGRWDRMPNASMHLLKTTVEDNLQKYEGLTILLNMGLHFVSNPVAKFTRDDYISQMTECLVFLNGVAQQYANKKVRVIWRETSAQHFPTPNGYWPGARYAPGMKLKCEPIADNSTEGDWRNADIRDIVHKEALKHVQIIPFYNVTLPLWSSHVNGHLRDCTHFCWSPMLYQSLFHLMADEVSDSV
jgi:hypothetical protein